eukprot:jgi/Psemu1/66668/estExt_Genemark1.C_2290003
MVAISWTTPAISNHGATKTTRATALMVPGVPIRTTVLHDIVSRCSRSMRKRTPPELLRHCCFGVRRKEVGDAGSSASTPENEKRYAQIHEEVLRVAEKLWGGNEHMPSLAPVGGGENDNDTDPVLPLLLSSLWTEGEASLPDHIPYSERGAYFRNLALEGCPKAQHSYGLLLWSGFAGIEPDSVESAKYHAAAACQHHLDAIAILGGCVRTGTGMGGGSKQTKGKGKGKGKRNQQDGKPNAQLGLELIRFCAEVAGNPSGVNKHAAQLERDGFESEAAELYRSCYDNGRANALVVFNLGWCYRHGQGVDSKNASEGIGLWKEAARMAPDEGSEEAAWNLSQEYSREDPREAQKWRDLAEELGYYE